MPLLHICRKISSFLISYTFNRPWVGPNEYDRTRFCKEDFCTCTLSFKSYSAWSGRVPDSLMRSSIKPWCKIDQDNGHKIRGTRTIYIPRYYTQLWVLSRSRRLAPWSIHISCTKKNRITFWVKERTCGLHWHQETCNFTTVYVSRMQPYATGCASSKLSAS